MHLITPQPYLSPRDSLSPDHQSSVQCSRKEIFILKRGCIKRIGLQMRFLNGANLYQIHKKKIIPNIKYLGKSIYSMVKFTFYRFRREKNQQKHLKYVDYLKLVPVLEESKQFVFLVYAQETHFHNIFVTRVNCEDPCFYLLVTLLVEMWNSWWLQKEFGHG